MPAETIATVNTVDPVNSLLRPRENMTMAEPEWRRVAAEIRDEIRADDDRYLSTRANGARRLPTYDQLKERHGTSYGTLRTALIALEAEGWIVRRPGVGLLVAGDHPQ